MLSNRMRLLWSQHVYWTRLVIGGIVFNSPDTQKSTERPLRNPGDFSETLVAFYGEEAMKAFKRLFTAHLTIAAQLVGELKTGNNRKAAVTEKNWYENAGQLAAFFATVNPCWMQMDWQEMLYRHLDMTKKEAAAFITGDYAASVAVFDCLEQEAMEMADMMTEGIARQFCFR